MFKKLLNLFHSKPDKDLNEIFFKITKINLDTDKEKKKEILNEFIKEIKFFNTRLNDYSKKGYIINEDKLLDMNNQTLRLRFENNSIDTINKLYDLNNYLTKQNYDDIRMIPRITLEKGIINFNLFFEYTNTDRLIDNTIYYLDSIVDLLNKILEEKEFNILTVRFQPIFTIAVLIIDYINQELIEYNC